MWRESLWEGWETFRRQPLPFLLTTLIYGVAANALGDASTFAFPRFGAALVSVLTGPCLGGLALLAMQVRRGETVDINEAFRPWKRPGDYLVVGLALAAGALVFVVGAVVTYSVFLFAPVIVAQGAGYARALARSRDLVLRHWPVVLPLAGVILAASLLAQWLTWSLGLLVVVPVGIAATCALLERLDGVEAREPERGEGDGMTRGAQASSGSSAPEDPATLDGGADTMSEDTPDAR